MRFIRTFLPYIITFCILFTGLAPISSSFAQTGRTFYVATSGNNAGDGSSTNPWKTIKYASQQVSAGDTVIISGGTYDGDYIWSYASGTKESPITFKAAEGEKPIITGSGLYEQILHFQSENTFFVVDGLHTLDTTATIPVYMIGCSNITLKKLYF